VIAHAGAADESLAAAMFIAAAWLGWIGWRRVRGAGFDRLPRNAGFGFLAGAVVVAALAVWAPRAIFPRTDPMATTTGPRIASTATLGFTSPTQDEVVEGDLLEVQLDLRRGTVVEQTSGALAPDEGHIHLTVDGSLVSMSYGPVQSVDLRAYGPGRHTFEAEFVAADHLPFDPPVTATVEVQTR
jgi:hypothetical protein